MLRPADFALAMRHGAHVGTTNLVIHQYQDTAESGNSHPALVGFVVPKRFVHKATKRNLVKRRLRHLIRQRLTVLPENSRTVIYAKAGADEASAMNLATQIDKGLQKVAVKLGNNQ